jgi:hypothetical protein
MRSSLSNTGSTDDIKISLYYVNPSTPDEARKTLEWLEYSLETEIKDTNRSTVIKMIQVKIRNIKKRFQPYNI